LKFALQPGALIGFFEQADAEFVLFIVSLRRGLFGSGVGEQAKSSLCVSIHAPRVGSDAGNGYADLC